MRAPPPAAGRTSDMDKFSNQVLRFIREQGLIKRGSTVAVGFSGGADSVCLLAVLCGLRALLHIELLAVHVNHNLRGEEAQRDEAFCRDTAARFGVPFRAVSVNVRERAEADGLSTEEAARMLRYEAFEEICEAYGKERQPQQGSGAAETDGRGYGGKAVQREAAGASASRKMLLATAHHADDQAETILLNLLRGAGLRGLSGMEAKRGRLIRPLLCVSKKEILAWLSERQLPYVTDSTNLENDYTRNYLRNCILPKLCEAVNERAPQHILKAGACCGEADAYLRGEAAAFFKEYAVLLRKDGGRALFPAEKYMPEIKKSPARGAPFSEAREGADGMQPCAAALPKNLLKEKPQIFRRYVIMEALTVLGVPLKDWGERHFADIDKALFAGNGYHLDLPGRVHAENEHRKTVLYRAEKS